MIWHIIITSVAFSVGTAFGAAWCAAGRQHRETRARIAATRAEVSRLVHIRPATETESRDNVS